MEAGLRRGPRSLTSPSCSLSSTSPTRPTHPFFLLPKSTLLHQIQHLYPLWTILDDIPIRPPPVNPIHLTTIHESGVTTRLRSLMVAAAPKSCSSCRFRKIKCDRRQKLQEANASDDSDVKCSPCSLANTTCTFISAPPKQRLGKRIRQLRDNEHDELLYGSQDPSTSSSATSALMTQDNLPNSNGFGFDYSTAPPSSTPSTSALPMELWRRTTTSIPSNSSLQTGSSSNFGQNLLRPGMFGIRGLSRQLLESCIAAYLFTVSPTLPIIRPDSFIPRLRSFFKIYSGELMESGMEPLDELLVVATACAGAACLNEETCRRKFELQTDLLNAFDNMVQLENGERLRRSGLDGVAACYLVSVVREDKKSDEGLFFCRNQETATGTETETSPLKIIPGSTEGVVRIATSMGLHVRSPETTNKTKSGFISRPDRKTNPTGPVETEGFARNRIWWCILGNDAFRAMAYRRPPYISEDSFDHGGDGKVNNVADLQGLPPWIIFEFQWLSSMVTVTFLARSILPRILSERARRKGVDVVECSRVIQSLAKWRNELPSEVNWDAQHQPGIHGSGVSVPERAFKCRLRSLYVECLYHLSVLAVYYGLEEGGFKHLNNQTKESAEYLPEIVNPPISVKEVRSSKSSTPSSTLDLVFDPKFSRALSRTETLASSTFERLAKILPQAAEEGMIRASPSVIRATATSSIIWATEIVVRRAEEGARLEDLTKILDQAQNLIGSVATCDSSQSTPRIVKTMEEALSRARNSVKNIVDNRRHSSSTTSASAQTPSSPEVGIPPSHQTPMFTFTNEPWPNNPIPDFCPRPTNSDDSNQTQSSTSDPISLLPTSNLGTESDQVPEWLAEFVGSGNQDSLFDFPNPVDQF